MIVEYNGNLYKVDFTDDGKIAYYKQIDGKWILDRVEDL